MALVPYHTYRLVYTGYPRPCFVLPTVLPIQNLLSVNFRTTSQSKTPLNKTLFWTPPAILMCPTLTIWKNMWDSLCTPYVPLTEATRLTLTDNETASQPLVFHVSTFTTQPASSPRSNEEIHTLQLMTPHASACIHRMKHEIWAAPLDSEIEELLILIYVRKLWDCLWIFTTF